MITFVSKAVEKVDEPQTTVDNVLITNGSDNYSRTE